MDVKEMIRGAVCAAVLRAKARHPQWGPKKLNPLEDEAEKVKAEWPVASTRGAILSRAQLEQRLYGWGEEVESNALDVHLHSLRRKLGAQFILNVRGLGWRVRPE